jgi:hypothetical protein
MENVYIFYGHLVYFTAIRYTYFIAMSYILWPFGIFCGHLVYFVAIWYILWIFGIFFHILVCCSKKNLATLVSKRFKMSQFIRFGVFMLLPPSLVPLFFFSFRLLEMQNLRFEENFFSVVKCFGVAAPVS